jgi:hypothetical protein
MNASRYETGAIHISTGWIGFYQLAHRPERFYVAIDERGLF